MSQGYVTLDESTLKWIVATINKEIKNADDMRSDAAKMGVITAEQWCEGKRDGLVHAKLILRAAGINFQDE